MKKILTLLLAMSLLTCGTAWAKKKKSTADSTEGGGKRHAASKTPKGHKGNHAQFESEITSKDVQFNAGDSKTKKSKGAAVVEDGSR